MALLFNLKQGALLPAIPLTLSASYDFDLSAATAVEFRYRKQPGGVAESVALTVTNATAKEVQLAPSAGMVDTLGTFDCHIKVTIDGKDMYFPPYGFDTFRIGETF